MKNHIQRAVGAGLLLAASAGAGASSGLGNPATLARSALIPGLGETGLQAPGQTTWRLALDLSNEYVAEATADEGLLIDGETSRLRIGFAHGLGTGLELTAELPLLIQGGGWMDGPIEDWHRFFGLPNGGREFAPRDRLRRLRTVDGRTVFEASRSAQGLGDLRLGLGYSRQPGRVWRAQLLLPTAEDRDLAGGSRGLALWLDQALPFSAGSGFSGALSLGGSWSRAEGPLAEDARESLALLGVELGWQPSPRWRLSGELLAHSALYRGSALAGLDRPGVPGGLFLARRLGEGGRWLRLGFQEDLATRSSPDFTLHLGLDLGP
ncbi:MAG TPA: DUF3187 family protein [Nevskiaceae bacterium]|nr:DUF3187 family protein [Nevskiaceae bacterium]